MPKVKLCQLLGRRERTGKKGGNRISQKLAGRESIQCELPLHAYKLTILLAHKLVKIINKQCAKKQSTKGKPSANALEGEW